MSRHLFRLGRLVYRRRRYVLVGWLVVFAAAAGIAFGAGGQTNNDFTIPGTESQQAIEQLQERLPAFSGADTQVTFYASGPTQLADPSVAAAVTQAMTEAQAIPQVTMAAGPPQTGLISPDGQLGIGTVRYSAQLGDVSDSTLTALQDAMRPAQAAGVEVDYSGRVYPGWEVTVPLLPEVVGVVAALVILLITFGAVVAAGLPLMTAIAGVGTSMCAIIAFAAVVEMPTTALSLALMLGLACGIDYALFILSRHRNNMLVGMDTEDSAALAVGTAGSAVVFAGLTVIIALCGLAVVQIPFLTTMGLAAAGAVMIALLVALTLLPALLGFAGNKATTFLSPPLSPGRPERVALTEAHEPQRNWGGTWGRLVVRFRIPLLLSGIVVLVVFAVPAASMQLGLPSGASEPPSSTARQAYDQITDHFGAGFNGPLLAVVDLSNATSPEAIATIADRLDAKPNTVLVAPVISQNETGIIRVIPSTGPNDAVTADLVHTLREDRSQIVEGTGVEVLIGGTTASNIDTSEKLSSALPIFLAVVIGLAFILLTLAFRAALVPITSIIGFLLSVFAALGLHVAVFQWGWGAELLGITPGQTISFLPVIVLAIIFGLSCDYQLFVVSRIKEQYTQSGDSRAAVAAGVALSARVVTAAALIMVGVFVAFLVADDPIIKSIAFTLAAGVLLDAFVVRLTLIPAAMSILRSTMWVHSRWFGKYVPDLDIEGKQLEHSDAR